MTTSNAIERAVRLKTFLIALLFISVWAFICFVPEMKVFKDLIEGFCVGVCIGLSVNYLATGKTADEFFAKIGV